MCKQGISYSILELKQFPRCQVFLKSIKQLFLGNDVTSSDVLVKAHFYFKILCTTYTMDILKNTQGQKQNFIDISSYLSVSTWPKFHIVR